MRTIKHNQTILSSFFTKEKDGFYVFQTNRLIHYSSHGLHKREYISSSAEGETFTITFEHHIYHGEGKITPMYDGSIIKVTVFSPFEPYDVYITKDPAKLKRAVRDVYYKKVYNLKHKEPFNLELMRRYKCTLKSIKRLKWKLKQIRNMS